jgi:WD40 repeat protein
VSSRLFQTLLLVIITRTVDCWGLAFSSDGKYIATTGQSGNINLWNCESGVKEMSLNTDGKFTMSVAFVRLFLEIFLQCYQSPNGKYVACGSQTGNVFVFDLGESKRLYTIDGNGFKFNTFDSALIQLIPWRSDHLHFLLIPICYSQPQMTCMFQFTICTDNNYSFPIKIVNSPSRSTNKPVANLSGHSSWVLAVACNPNSKNIATGLDYLSTIWEMNFFQFK